MIEFFMLLFLIVVAIISNVFYVRSQVSSVKSYVKKELITVVNLINEAQRTEFNFDKQNEQNIRKLEKQLVDVMSRLDRT